MKIICTLVIILLGFGSMNAQIEERNPDTISAQILTKNKLFRPASNGYYYKLTLGYGTHLVLNQSFHHVNKRGFSLGFQQAYEIRRMRNLPEDFERGFLFARVPSVIIKSQAVLVGKVMEHPRGLMQFDLRGGINFGTVQKPVNFVKKSKTEPGMSPPFSNNYKYDIEKKSFVGLVINPTVNLNLSRVVGLSLGARANLNPNDISVGFEAGLILGYLRGKRKIMD